MSIRVTENLVLPDGSPMKSAEITVTTIKSESVLKGSFIKECSDNDTGAIDFPLYAGIYNVTVRPYKSHISLDEDIEIPASMVSPVTLTNLTNNYIYVKPEEPTEG